MKMNNKKIRPLKEQDEFGNRGFVKEKVILNYEDGKCEKCGKIKKITIRYIWFDTGAYEKMKLCDECFLELNKNQ